MTAKRNSGQSRIQAFNRGLITAAAVEVFAQHGFRGATLDQIAGRAEMSKANILYYFPSKRDIYNATIDSTLENWLGSLERMDPNGDPGHELERYITDKIRFSLEHPAASRLFANEVLHGAENTRELLNSRLKQLMDDKSKALRRWMKAGYLAKVDPYNLIFVIFAATQTFADFAAQIEIVTGKTLADPKYFSQVSKDVIRIILQGVVLK